MAVDLEGGCRVTTLREGVRREEGNLSIWRNIGRDSGAKAISLRTLDFSKGRSKGIRNGNSDEVLYVLQGTGTIFIEGYAFAIAPETGIYIKPNQIFAVDNPHDEPLVLISSQCPEPEQEALMIDAIPEVSPQHDAHPDSPMVRLSDRRAVPTADRWYRVLVDEAVGCRQVTQFVGSIPPGRAPDHFHKYEEVLYILRGKGRMWADKSNTPIEPGCCVYLPKGQIHCVENTGESELRLLGVFYPAGSPAVRYDAD